MIGWENTSVVNTGILLALAVFLIVRSRHWTAPVQSQRIGLLEDDVRVVRGNVLRLERDQAEAHRQYMDSNAEILKEVRSITANGALHPICDELKVIEDRLLDVEQVVASMPCRPACTPTKEKNDA
jgi:hypothetical protein